MDKNLVVKIKIQYQLKEDGLFNSLQIVNKTNVPSSVILGSIESIRDILIKEIREDQEELDVETLNELLKAQVEVDKCILVDMLKALK